ncbi:MAG TPA: hypothetical protein VI248_25100 [Kineosporiaceae bacterium]
MRGPLYARVDFLLPRPGLPVLMELELLEPDLYLRDAPGAVGRFADALAARASAPRVGGTVSTTVTAVTGATA